MDETFNKIEKNLFCRTAKLKDSTYSKTFYVLFVDKLRHKQRSFAVGGDLNIARARKGELMRKSYALYDFDEEKQRQKKATLPSFTVPSLINSLWIRSRPSFSIPSHPTAKPRLIGLRQLSHVVSWKYPGNRSRPSSAVRLT